MGGSNSKSSGSFFSSSDDFSTSGLISGQRVGGLVLPSQTRQVSYDESIGHLEFTQRLGEGISIEIETVRVGSNRIACETFMPSNNAKKIIIYLVGNGQIYQDLYEDMAADVNLDCAVVGFNYPNVDKSLGKVDCWNSLVTSVVGFVEHVIDKHEVRPCDIILKTHSIGGAIGTYAAERLHAKNKDVFLFNGRSLADINKLISQQMGFNESLASTATSLTGWNAQPGEKFNTIPEEYRRFVTAKDDPVIGNNASILEDQLKRAKTDVEKQFLKDHYLLDLPPNQRGDKHNCPLSSLKNSLGQTGEDIFKEFVLHTMEYKPTIALTF